MGTLKVTVITAFPEFINSFLHTSIVGRAIEGGLIEVRAVDIRDFAEGNYRQIDNYSFGGKGGMTIMPEILYKALQSVKNGRTKVLFPTPVGAVLTQDLVEALSAETRLEDKDIVIICGHYEGLDERFVAKYVDLEYSIGDYVLTGGEIPAMVLIDALSRLVPGVVGKKLSVTDDSFYNGMLDTPHFTRPAEWQGIEVPEELLSGNDAVIEKWRKRTAAALTLSRRPDLLARANVIDYLECEAYLAIEVDPDQSNLIEELSFISKCAQCYGIVRTIAIPNSYESFNKLRKKLSALPEIKCVPSANRMADWANRKKRGTLNIIAAEVQGGIPWLDAKRRLVESDGPVLILFGKTPKITPGCTKVTLMRPQKTIGGVLPRTALVSATLDRFFGPR